MYLSEEKRAEIRECIHHQQAVSGKEKAKGIHPVHGTEDARKVSQILFEARDGKEVFTPFYP